MFNPEIITAIEAVLIMVCVVFGFFAIGGLCTDIDDTDIP